MRSMLATLGCLLLLTPLASAPASADEPPAPADSTLPASATASPEATVEAGASGFTLRSADGDFTLRLRTLLQADSRVYSDDGPDTDGWLVRRARVELGGSVYGRFEYRITSELAGSGGSLLDGWLRWNASPGFQLQAGKMKLPVGLERAQAREHSLFNELGYATALVPNRDIGIAAEGVLASRRVAYFVGVFDGTPDGGSVANGDGDDHRELAARLFLTPFAEGSAAEQLGFGVAGTYGSRAGTPAALRTVGQQTFFRWRDGVVNDGTAWRLAPQLHHYQGPFSLLADAALSSQRLALGGVAREVEVTAWNVSAGWVLTGEDATYRGVSPRRPIAAEPGGRGAWQVVVRATTLEVDRAAFPGLADPSRSARRAFTLSAGVSWYLNRAIRLATDLHHTDLEGGPLADERALIARAQLRF